VSDPKPSEPANGLPRRLDVAKRMRREIELPRELDAFMAQHQAQNVAFPQVWDRRRGLLRLIREYRSP